MKILSLDISSKTGFALSTPKDGGVQLLEYGTIPKVERPKTLAYPSDYVAWARLIFDKIEAKILQSNADLIIIEETSKGSKDAHSQKILEWVHYLVAEKYGESGKLHYLMTGEWRGLVGCSMTKEESKRNKSVKTQRLSGTKVAKDANGKRIGKITKKHVNVRRVKELFDITLKLSENDTADALLLNLAGYLKIVAPKEKL